MMTHTDAAKPLKDYRPHHDFFVGIDSDGCVFDTMEIKQKECFIPNIVKHWNLQAVSKYVRETAEFVNLYSQWRGINRWPALTMVFDLLAERPEVRKRQVEIPAAQSLRDWIQRETKLGNPALKAEAAKTGDPVLAQALRWSEAVNTSVADIAKNIPPFPYVRESLEQLRLRADVFVVSQTPTEALLREWQEHRIDGFAEYLAGQELGTKTEHIRYAADGKYGPARMLMIGDAPGDLKAARANQALFYPIVPGREEQSWQRFYEEAMDRFFAVRYAGSYEEELIAEFDRHLPAVPPWKK